MAGLDPGVAARPLPLPGAFHDPVGESEGDIAGSIAAAIEHDDDLVGKGECRETIDKLPLFIVSDDQGGQVCLLRSFHPDFPWLGCDEALDAEVIVFMPQTRAC